MNEYKLNGESKDILAENISKLKGIFPEIITEDKIDFDKLKLILGENVETDRERYNFTWPGKTQAIKESQKQSTGTLRPCKEESKNWDTTQNLYIEGDNLEVLKLLQKTYYNKIKMIYIDPPYNTGNDFIYPDNYKDNIENYLEITGQSSKLNGGGGFSKISTNTETNGRYHSNWLNMMYPRLKLAKNLLKNDGIIFISIDENEIENLKKVCNEIFGEENFITSFAWLNTVSSKLTENTQFAGANLGKIKKAWEYVLTYGKTSKIKLLPEKSEDKYIIKLITNGGNKISEIIIPKGVKCNNIINKTIKGKVGGEKDYYKILNKEGMIIKNGILTNDVKIRGPLRNPVTLQRYFNNEVVIDRKGQKLIDVFLSDNGMLHTKKERLGNTPSNIIIGKGSAKHGTLLLKKMFGFKIFDFSKPIGLLEYLIERVLKDNDIVMDFFSGSGSLGHSLMKFNQKNNVDNNFILVQFPEPTDEKSEAYKAGYKNICEIGKERIRRAGDKILGESDNKDLDIGFKVFKLDSSNLQKWDPDYKNLAESLDNFTDNIKEDRTEEDLVYEIMLKYGIDLTLPIQKENTENHTIYSIGHGALLICLDDNITKDITKPIIDLSKDSVSTRVVFKDNGFKSDSDKTNIKETLKVNNIEEFITI